ncbi:MAG: bacillithiol system redox-active protein YtxJ [Bacteroidetes bacterium]|nr:bacillithiol system redox-active protein YtxJ [Bacteroidota bacterium]
MNWNKLTDIKQLDQIDAESKEQKILILKHSTRCSISAASLNRLERKWKEDNAKQLKPYFLDLLNHRDISDAIAARYKVEHHSPQTLVISDGKCIFTQSHSEITLQDALET